jgi:iron complex transport system substrate-binding protein
MRPIPGPLRQPRPACVHPSFLFGEGIRPVINLRHRISRLAFVLCAVVLAGVIPLAAQKKPQRIVSTAPSITESLFALGLGHQVVGVSRFCSFPPEVLNLPRVGTYLNPDPEAIARLAPDLVVLEKGSTQLKDRLGALHIAYVEVPHDTLDEIYSEIEIIAKAAGVPDRGTALVAQIKTSLASIESKSRSLPSPRVIVIVDRKQGTLGDMIAVGPDNYVNQILEIAGADNVLAMSNLPHYPHISLETVIRENPDVIIDLSGTQESPEAQEVSRASALTLWKARTELKAVRNGHVYAGTSNVLVVPGPRTPLATQRLFDYIHGSGGAS